MLNAKMTTTSLYSGSGYGRVSYLTGVYTLCTEHHSGLSSPHEYI